MGQKKAKGLQKSKVFLNKLSNIFVKSSLEKIYHFYKDDFQASIIFKGVNQFEEYYLVTFKNLLNSVALQASFNMNLQALFREVKAVLPSRDKFNIKTKILNQYPGKMCDVMFTKVPVYNNSVHNIWVDTITKNKEHASDVNATDLVDPSYTKSEKHDPKSECATDVDSDTALPSNSVQTPSKTSMISNKSQRHLYEDRKQIVFHASGVLHLTDSEATDKGAPNAGGSDKHDDIDGTSSQIRRATDRGLSRRAVRLIEDMSVPFKCDKALKMMQGMGWTGGALGLRGEGIVEPLMPVFNHVTGAGLGHVAKEKGLSKQANKLERKLIMQAILDLLSTDVELTITSFPTPLEAATIAFLSNSVTKLCARSHKSWEPDIVALATQALELMMMQPDVFVQADVSPDKKRIKLRKLEVTNGDDLSNSDVTVIGRRAYMRELLEPVFSHDLELILDDLTPACTSKKAYKNLRFRIENLVYILDFVNSNSMCKSKSFHDILSRQNKAFLTLTVDLVNQGRPNGNNVAEKEMMMIIHRAKGEWDLTVEFKYNNREYSVRKIYGTENRKIKIKLPVSPKESEVRKPAKHIVAPNLKITTKTEVKTNKCQNTNGGIPEVVVLSDDSCDVIEKDISRDTESPDVTIIETKCLTIDISDDDDENSQRATTPPKASITLTLEERVMEFEKSRQGSATDSNQLTKRSRTVSQSIDLTNNTKKGKKHTKKVHIVPIDYPENQLTKPQVQSIQKLISFTLESSADLPLLKCHGLENGALAYTSHSKNSLKWLLNSFSEVSDVKIVDDVEVAGDSYDLELRFNCYFDYDFKYLFDKLELYNGKLSTLKWKVLQKSSFHDHVLFTVNVDKDSYDYICGAGFSLYAGVDIVQFILVSQ